MFCAPYQDRGGSGDFPEKFLLTIMSNSIFFYFNRKLKSISRNNIVSTILHRQTLYLMPLRVCAESPDDKLLVSTQTFPFLFNLLCLEGGETSSLHLRHVSISQVGDNGAPDRPII